ncbi:MAG: hypothetical protein HUJ93_02710 [Bacteroidales bacterium]|nr:hypothetical protein [Bacteroidales bacterium]
MKKIIIATAAFILTLCPLAAQQQAGRNLGHLEMEKFLQKYSTTGNAAGMGLDQPENGSFTTLGGYYEGGDYHRVQQPGSLSGISFETERFDTFSKTLAMRGSFKYDYGYENDRVWSDVMDPYDSNPFIYGSRVTSRFETQKCAIAFDLYTRPLSDKISLGVKFKYDVADISGKRDPRPRTHYLGYSAAPSFLFIAGNHQFGADAGYVFSKEKLNNLTTVQSYPNLWYYTMSGVEHCDGSIGGYSGFKRQFTGNGFTTGVQYGYRNGAIRYLLEGRVDSQWQTVWGDKKQSPGSYQRNNWNILSDLLIEGDKICHNLIATAILADGGATEYLQELQSTKDPVTGVTTETWETLYTYKNRLVRNKFEAKLSWTTYGIDSEGASRWYAGAFAGYKSFKDEHYLPHSWFSSSSAEGGVNGKFRIFDRKGHQIELAAEAYASFCIESDLQLSVESLYGKEVILPDFRYFNRNIWSATGSARWTFPLRFKKNTLQGYLEAKGGDIFAGAGLSRYSATITLGLLTF